MVVPARAPVTVTMLPRITTVTTDLSDDLADSDRRSPSPSLKHTRKLADFPTGIVCSGTEPHDSGARGLSQAPQSAATRTARASSPWRDPATTREPCPCVRAIAGLRYPCVPSEPCSAGSRSDPEGELWRLEQAWREAEEIAAISDDLLLPEGCDRVRRAPPAEGEGITFAGGLAIASCIWSETLEADAFSWFAAEGVLNRYTGRTFRE